VKIRDTVLAELMEIGDTLPVDGYTLTDYQANQRSHRRTVTSAPRVDFDFEVSRSRQSHRLTVVVYMEDTTPALGKAKEDDLLALVEADQWVLDVYGDSTTEVWLCDAADSEHVLYNRGAQREVTLTIPARPAF
jgi:hypothetical protein